MARLMMLAAVLGVCGEESFEPDHASRVDQRCQEKGIGFADGGNQQIMNKWQGATLADVFREYENLNPQGFRGTTRPFISTQAFTGVVVNNLGAPVMSHCVFRAGQNVSWFSFG